MYSLTFLEQLLQTKSSQSINIKTPFTLQMTTNENNHYHTSIPKDKFSHMHQQLPSILRHISTPSLELFHNNHINSMSLFQSTIQRSTLRKKQPRTNPNYVNIDVKTQDGTLRSTYIHINDAQNCQTLLTVSSSSSSSSNSSFEQGSMIFNSQSCLNESNGYFPSDETISSDNEKINPLETNGIIINRKSPSLSSLSSTDKNENETNIARTAANKTDHMMKQFVTCTDGKYQIYCNNYVKNANR